MRLKLVPDNIKINFFQSTRLTFGASVLAMVISIFLFFFNGLNLGIDFLGGTTIRTDAQTSVDHRYLDQLLAYLQELWQNLDMICDQNGLDQIHRLLKQLSYSITLINNQYYKINQSN